MVRYQRKPDWVIDEVVRLKAHLPSASGYTIASVFNQIHHKRRNMTISKSYAYALFIKHQHQILSKRRRIKQQKPRHYNNNQLWQLDLTKVNRHQVLGLIDCGSRACLSLKTIPNKKTITPTASIT